jgi:hypothetical protein
MTKDIPRNCPHCQSGLVPFRTPPNTSWGGNIHYACFNDDCPYFKRGWKWMAEKYEAHASYRFMVDPVNGTTGPLPVWSSEALRDRIVTDEELTEAEE